MRIALTLALLLTAGPALSQVSYDVLEGAFGSATDPTASCAANPHELAIIDDRPHIARIWKTPVTGNAGSPRLREVYDLEGFDGTEMVVTEEGLYRADSDGGTGGIWVMKLTQSPPGYCWRRPEWPEARCEDQQLRCESPTS